LWYSDSDLVAEKHALTSAMRALEVLQYTSVPSYRLRTAAIRLTRVEASSGVVKSDRDYRLMRARSVWF
jgi:hypothetical protein